MDAVLLTGSSGPLGSAIAEELAMDYELIGLDSRAPGTSTGLTWIECNFMSRASVKAAADQVAALLARAGSRARLASIIHLAPDLEFLEDSGELQEASISVSQGAEHLLREFLSFGPEQLLLASTLLVMAPSESGDLLTERAPVRAVREDSRAKLAIEDLIERKRGGIPFVILRLAEMYDEEGLSPTIAHHIDRVYRRRLESYFYPGDKRRGQSFLHLRDAAVAFRRALEARSILGPHEVFLIGEPDVMSYEELQEQIGSLLHGKSWPVIRIPKPVAKAGAWAVDRLKGEHDGTIRSWMTELTDAHYPISTEKARRVLGWAPVHSLRDTLSKIVGGLRANPSRWYALNGMRLPEQEDLRKGTAA